MIFLANCFSVPEKPWWRDARQLPPGSVRRGRYPNPWLAVGSPAAIIFGGGFLLRLLFPRPLGTSASFMVFYGVLGIAGLMALVIGVVQQRKNRHPR